MRNFAKKFANATKILAFFGQNILFAENPNLRVSGGGSTCAEHTPWNTIVVNINMHLQVLIFSPNS